MDTKFSVDEFLTTMPHLNMLQLPSHIVDLESDESSLSPLSSPPPSDLLSPTPGQLGGHPNLSRLDIYTRKATPMLTHKPTSKTTQKLTQRGTREAARKPSGKRIAGDSEFKSRSPRKPRVSKGSARVLKSVDKTLAVVIKGRAQLAKPMTASKSSENVNEAIEGTPKSTKSADEWEALHEIRDRRGAKDFIEYQVRWGGYDSADPRAKSWVPRTMLMEDVPEDVEEFDRKFSPAKRARRV